MKTTFHHNRSGVPGRGWMLKPFSRAFSLIELMVVVSLLSVIILGLMAMFSQTQRAFKLGMNQVDILESGRMAADLITREVEQATPTYVPRGPNASSIAPNFIVMPAFSFVMENAVMQRSNVMDDLFFVIRENKTWMGVGYFVRTTYTNAVDEAFGPVGSLYRYEFPMHEMEFVTDPRVLYRQFQRASYAQNYDTNRVRISRIIDGVTQFRVRVFDPAGKFYPFGHPSTNIFYPNNTNSISVLVTPGSIRAEFHSNAIPGFVEIELGVLESETLDRYLGLPPVPEVRARYVRDKLANMHLFRQRIPLRNVDLSAYPPTAYP